MFHIENSYIKIGICVLVVLILFLSYFFGIIKPTCDGEECFAEKLSSCKPSKYDQLANNNIYEYEISRSLGSTCKFTISLRKSSEGTDFETKGRLEGKSMSCVVPKSELSIVSLKEVNNFLKYCTGPLKEGVYEIIIKDMYTVIISNLGEILGEVQTSVIKKI